MSRKTKHKKQHIGKSKKQKKSKHADTKRRRNKSRQNQAEFRKVMSLIQEGISLGSSGLYEAAIKKFEQVEHLAPENKDALDMYLMALHDTGVHLKNSGNCERAIELYNKVLDIQPDHIHALNNYGVALKNLGFYELAIEQYIHVLKLAPENVTALMNYGIALKNLGFPEAAIEKYEQALEIEPNDSKVLQNYCTALNNLSISLGLFIKNLNSYEEALSTYGRVLLEAEYHNEAISKFKKALQMNPENNVVLNNYAVALCRLNQYEEATHMYEKALNINPNQVSSLVGYGSVLFDVLNQYGAAVEKYEQALKIAPDDLQALLNYGVTLAKAGYYKDVIEKYEKALIVTSSSQEKMNFLHLTLGSLYYLIKSEKLGDKHFNLAIENSEDQDAARIQVAQQIFAEEPYSEKGVAILQEITETSPYYQEAFKSLTLNLTPKAFFEMFKTRSTDDETLRDTELLNRAMYHKIANEIVILKETVHLLISGYNIKDSGLSDILDRINALLDGIRQRRDREKAQVKEIPADDYDAVITTISETAHDISDFANNELATLEEKIRMMLVKSSENDRLTKKLKKMLEQIKFSQNALHDLKSVNEGIRIRNSSFEVKDLFENWEDMSKISHATLSVDIRNGESTFYGDKEKIRSFVKELVENSLRHNPDKEDLLISIISQDGSNVPYVPKGVLARQSTFLIITVSDNGKGIPPEKKEWVFLPLKTSSEEGSGLGLFIIKRTLKEMHGHILETGTQGAKFEIYIPYLQGGETWNA